jgi:hypothetical protein
VLTVDQSLRASHFIHLAPIGLSFHTCLLFPPVRV